MKHLLLLVLIGCASKPKIWRDKYGILHRENVTTDDIVRVTVLDFPNQLPGACIRLRNIYLDGRVFKDYELKTETAKQFGTHVVKSYYNGVQDIMGVAYDCKNKDAYRRIRDIQKLMMRNMAMSEVERRTYERQPINKVKDSIPQFDE